MKKFGSALAAVVLSSGLAAPLLISSTARAEDFVAFPTFAADYNVPVTLNAYRIPANGAVAGHTVHTEGVGVGLRLGMSMISSFGHEPKDGFFVRDYCGAEVALGKVIGTYSTTETTLYGIMWVQIGLALGVASGNSSFYLYPHAYTGFNTTRTGLGGRDAWVIGLGANFPSFGADVGWGRAGGDSSSVYQAEMRIKVLPATSLISLLILRYEGVYGGQNTEHDLTLGMGARF